MRTSGSNFFSSFIHSFTNSAATQGACLSGTLLGSGDMMLPTSAGSQS